MGEGKGIVGEQQQDIEYDSKESLLKNNYVYILLILTAIGAFLRLYHLSFNSLWLDEGATYEIAKKSILDIWNTINLPPEYNPPLFYWIEHAMLSYGSREFILRLIPALVGIATIPLVYLIGKEIADRNTGIIAAALMTFAPFHIYYSQEARAYTLMTFFVALALLFLLKGFKQRGSSTWIFFGIASALAFWAHYYTLTPVAFFFAIAFFYTLKKSGSEFKHFLFGLLAFILISLPLFFVIVKMYFSITASAPTWGFQGISLIYETVFKMSASNVYIMISLIILFFLGISMLFIQDKGKFFLLVSFLIIPSITGVILSKKMPMDPRYLLYLLPAYFWGIAISHKIVTRFIRSRYIVYGFIILSILLLIPFSFNYYTKYSKEDWRGLSSYLQRTAKYQDYVVMLPGYVRLPFDYYYRNQSGNIQELEAYNLGTLEQISSLSENKSVYYVVTLHIGAMNPNGDMLDWLKKNAKYIRSFTGGLSLYKTGGY
jgi:4-amino-4-deoxy-L-arabinose transferase-like glycosyltransferase